MVAPYTPPSFATPIVNPSAGGFIAPVPYISVSQYKYAPTAMDTETLEPDGGAIDQTQVLADVIGRASAWADRIVFGTSPSAKGASLCASQSIQTGFVRMINGELRLSCDYKPILELSGLSLGTGPGDIAGATQDVANQIRFGIRTIYVPGEPILPVGGSRMGLVSRSGRIYAVWSYVAGYAHLRLAADADQGESTIEVEPNGPAGTLLGVYPGTPLGIDDIGVTESVNVQSVSGTTITLDSPLANDHTVPVEGPDFIPVTAIPADVQQAVIFLTTALIKTRGDNSIVLDEITEPTKLQSTADAVQGDIDTAMAMLAPFRTVAKWRS